MGILSRVVAQKHCSGNAKRCFTTEPVLSFDVSSPRNVEKTSSLHSKEPTHHDKKQIKEAQIIRCLCRIMESHVWGPNTEPLLQPYTPHLSNTVISQVILKQKSLDMAKRFFQWSRRCRPLTHNANVNEDNGDAGVGDIDVDVRGYDADVVVDIDAHFVVVDIDADNGGHVVHAVADDVVEELMELDIDEDTMTPCSVVAGKEIVPLLFVPQHP